jgi:periplasmic protein TonB
MVRLRLISLGLAAVICALLVYLALTGKFSAVTDMFNDADAVKAEIEEKEKPPPPPPPPPNRPPPPPPPEERVPPPMVDAPPQFTESATAPDPEPAPPAPVLTGIRWLQQPDGDDYTDLYPSRAEQREMEGRVVIDCTVAADGRIACTVASEDPPGWGFGEATLRVSRRFRVAPQTADGTPTAGGTFRKTIRWQRPRD